MTSPIFASLRRLNTAKDGPAIAFYSLLIGVYVVCASLPLCPLTQKIFLSKFHLTLEPFGQWAKFQFIPSMYNFDNELSWSPEPASGTLDQSSAHTVQRLAVNHYPLRLLSFTLKRRSFAVAKPVYVYVRSTYRGRLRVTSYLLWSTAQHIRFQRLNSYERSQ